MNQNTLTKTDLRQFTGTEQWHRHGIARNVLYTDGAQYVAESGGAYWLLEEIAFRAVLFSMLVRRPIHPRSRSRSLPGLAAEGQS